jgi:excisionase family DNA binding protein
MSTEAPILSEFLTPDELAAELKISPRTLDRWVALGEAPAMTRIGRKRLYRRSSVRAWLLAREQDRAA